MSFLVSIIILLAELTGSVSGLYSVSGSNKLIVEKLMDFSKVKLISAEAAAISKRNDQFQIQIEGQIPPIDDYEGNESSPKTGSNKIWKLFSSKNLTDSELSLYFNEIKNVKRASFLAYPECKKYSVSPKISVS
ncbi:Prenylcysteine lyase family protein [Brugia pahangi]